MSGNSTDVSSHVQAIQETMQDTGDGSDSDFSGFSEGEKEPSKKDGDNTNPTAVCSGDGGCGKTYPSDTPGCDFQYAMLCSTCYKKGDDETNVTVEENEDEDSDDRSVISVSDNNEDPNEESEKDEDTDAGLKMGTVLQNARDIDPQGRFDVEAGGNTNVYIAYINDQDNVVKKCKKFWHLQPNPTYVMYGFLNYHALLNTNSHRAWLGHCRLSTTKPGASGDGFVLWEVWETRCNKPRIDGILIKENGEVVRVQNIETWLKKNGLNSNIEAEFDNDFYQR